MATRLAPWGQPTTFVLPVVSGSGSVLAVGSIVGAGSTVCSGSGSVNAVGLIVGDGQTPAIPGCGNVSGVGLIVGAGECTRSGSASVACVGALVGVGYTLPFGSDSVVGIGSILGIGSTSRSGYGIIVGIGAIVGDGEETEIEQTQHALRFRRNDMRMLLRTHGESITYYPSGGGSRAIRALVERDVEIPGEVEQVAHAIVVRVLDDPTDGIASQCLNDGADEVELRLKIGAPKQRRQITRRITGVAGVTRFLVR